MLIQSWDLLCCSFSEICIIMDDAFFTSWPHIYKEQVIYSILVRKPGLSWDFFFQGINEQINIL